MRKQPFKMKNIMISNGYNKNVSYFENAKCKSAFAV